MADQCTKFEVSSVSRSGEITRGVTFKNGSPNPDYAPFREDFFSAGWDLLWYTRYDAMNGGAKSRKWGSLGQLGGTQGDRQCHYSIERVRLPIRL